MLTIILQLDSIYHFLNLQERIWLHQQRLEKSEAKTTEKIERIKSILENYEINLPVQKYNQTPELFFFKNLKYIEKHSIIERFPTFWIPIEEFSEHHPQITELIKKFKI